MDWTTILVTIFSTIAGGGIGAWLTYRVQNRKINVEEKAQESTDFKDMLDIWKQDNVRLRLRVEELEAREADNQKRISELESQVILLGGKL